MSNNNNLARERIEAAIELIEEQKEGADRVLLARHSSVKLTGYRHL